MRGRRSWGVRVATADFTKSSNSSGQVIRLRCRHPSRPRSCHSRKATGISGWSPRDLRTDQPITRASVTLFKAAEDGIPPHLLQARVCVLSKVALPEHIKQSCRMIVFSLLYRVWSSAVTREVLTTWSDVFPPLAIGSMPGHSCQDLTVSQQHAIERAILSRSHLLGCAVDIVKCFNQLGWIPLVEMMSRPGIPQEVLTMCN